MDDLRKYSIISLMIFLIILIGFATSTQPLTVFFIESLKDTLHTIITMVWITWWALVLGFAIAGGVEAWVSDEKVSEKLAGSGFRELFLASFFGFISSSCSYSAIATAKNLFKKGGSAASTVGAFMFAATNLVIEIGLVIWLLLGWQFVLANYIGGFVLIGSMALIFKYLVPDDVIEEARSNIKLEDTARDPNCGMDVDIETAEHILEYEGRTYYFCSESCKKGFNPDKEPMGIRQNMLSKKGWKKLASKQWKEWMMLWDEIAIGFIFAGFIAGFIPTSVWTSIFAESTLGFPLVIFWTAILGVLIGVITFVCSVGNVPFGAILWVNGLPFGSVLSYIYADLIVPPIMEAYREYYGLKFASVLVLSIFVSAIFSGIAIHFLFLTLDIIPPVSETVITNNSIELNYKAGLNVLFTIIFIILYKLQD